ncbi:MAG: GNAT family N-acetyltransferase [Planctomycetota bacterium]|nr:GNAT family N-acetyltransferase [Planctomycetota bacterium]MDA1163719.1 GNAT family N-acetyltransferase [Planctomycetota bacterium]
MIAVTELTTFDELANLRVTWRELWEKTPNASFVQSWDWMRSYWRAYGDNQELRTLLVTLRTRPIGIVPLVTRQVSTALGNASVLTWPTNSFVPFYGAIGPNPAATLSTAFSHVSKTRRHWNALELPQIDEFGHDNFRTKNALRNARLKPCRNGAVQHPVVEMLDNWDNYMGQRNLSSRMEFVQAEKHVSHFGPVSFHRWRPEGGKVGETDRRWDLFRVFEAIHRDTNSRLRRPDRELALMKDAHPAAVDAGAVEFCTLTVSGRPAACAYNYRKDGRLENVFLGVREEYGEATLTCLLGYMLRDSFMRDDTSIAFHPRDERRVTTWGNSSITSIAYGHYAKLSPAAQLLRRRRVADAGEIPAERQPVEVASDDQAAVSASESPLKVYSGA